mgnify:CR=1 FL=1
MKKLFKNKKGFTLMEMLIVVAIIVILVGVSMPVFTSQLEKSRDAANDANVRAAKAVAISEYLMNEKTGEYNYDAVNGKITKGKPAGYGRAVTENTTKGYEGVTEDEVIKVTITPPTGDDDDVTITTEWVAAAEISTTP